MASNGTDGKAKVPAWAADWLHTIQDTDRRGRIARNELWKRALELERDLGLRLKVTVGWSVTKQDVSSPSHIDIILDEATAAPEREARFEALLRERWPGGMREHDRAARLEKMRAAAAGMSEPRRRISVDKHEYLKGLRGKRPRDLSAPRRERWFWARVDAGLAGDTWTARAVAVTEAPATPQRKKLGGRRRTGRPRTKRGRQ